eukprot:COSAG02_NODE_44997_length_361_cov_0.748092_1_plen_90_part_10
MNMGSWLLTPGIRSYARCHSRASRAPSDFRTARYVMRVASPRRSRRVQWDRVSGNIMQQKPPAAIADRLNARNATGLSHLACERGGASGR